jgi:hypothetical protein
LAEVIDGRELDQDEVVLLHSPAASKLGEDALCSLYCFAHNLSPIPWKSSVSWIMMSEIGIRKYKVMDRFVVSLILVLDYRVLRFLNTGQRSEVAHKP